MAGVLLLTYFLISHHPRDPRQPAVPLRVHESTHSDDITTLSFASASIPGMKVILSGSSDGLVTTSNAEEEDGDNAILNVGNWGCSVSQAGWIRNSTGARIWVSSDMETFSTWTDEVRLITSSTYGRSPDLYNDLSLKFYKILTFAPRPSMGTVRRG